MELKALAYLIVFAGIVNLLRMTVFLVGSDIYHLVAAKRQKVPSSKKLPRFSIVIPARNEESSVIRAIESIINSTYPTNRLQVIVVDDGSTDSTVKNVQKYISTHKKSPVTLVQQANAGKAHALNNGIINHAKGDLVMCLDADSYLKADALEKAARYFEDPKVMAMSSNVKIHERPGILNFIQRYEYLVCYQMKRAESLLNIEYIVGGIGSVFRRTALEKVGYYDTDTVTEDIDITMKILNLGNKDHKVMYGADVVAYTESVMNIPDLIKQRFRWKWGRCQTFFKNSSMFLSRDKKYSKGLTWFYLPFAIFGDIMYFLEPIMLTYILAVSIMYKDPVTILSAWAVISLYLILNILAEDTYTKRQKAKLVLGAPLMYVLFYVLSFVEYIALMKSVLKLHTLKRSLTNATSSWTSVTRHGYAYAPARSQSRFPFKLTVVLALLTTVIAASYNSQIGNTAKAVTTNAKHMDVKTLTTDEKKIITEKKTVLTMHIVQPGENLWSIAKAYYGKGALWRNLKTEDAKLNPGDIVEVPVLK